MEPFSCWRVDIPLAVGGLEAKEAIVDGNDVAGVPQDEYICPSCEAVKLRLEPLSLEC